MADSFRVPCGADANEATSLQPLPLTLLELGCQEIPHLAPLSVNQRRIVKASLFKLKLDDSFQHFVAVL